MKKDYSRSRLAIFASYIVPHRKAFAIDMALSVGIAVVDLIFPYVSRWSMRNLLPEGLFQTFFVVMAIMFAAYILRAVCQYFVTVVGHRMGTLSSLTASLTATGPASCSRGSPTTCLRSWNWRTTARRTF